MLSTLRIFSVFVLFAVTACAIGAPGKQNQAGDDSVTARAYEILSEMTLEEKVGQVIQADISAVTPAQARDYNLGSVLNGGNSAPGGEKTAEPAEWIALADAFWEASTDKSGGRVGIPLLWGTDAVHGHNNLQYATIFPHNSALGAMHDAGLIREIAEVTAREVRATGIDWTFAPTLAVAQDDRWGRAYESFSEDPDLVALYASAFVKGLQGNPEEVDYLTGDHVIATAKHFIGDGGTEFGIDKGDTRGDVAEIVRLHGAGYGPAIDAGVQTVMSSFSSINGEKMHGSKSLLTTLLRDEMGFDGFVVGDWNGHAEVPGCTATDCPQALEAGIDMYMAPDSWQELYENLLAQVRSGVVSEARLDEAVLRILKVKIRAGLFEAGRPSERASSRPELLGAEAHRDVARRAVRASLVLLKNEGSVLPLQPGARVLVTGSGADSMEQQTGGWTLNWQGVGNSNEEFRTGETIFSGIKSAVEHIGGKAVLSGDGKYDTAPDVAIVVFGEQPYAEYRGDRRDLVFEFSDGENLAQMRAMKEAGIPVVAVFLTGRPLWVNPHLNLADAFVVAWLPGTEAGGIADVIIGGADGKPRHDFTGRLSFSWPENGAGAPINAVTDPGVLFPRGYGLSYASDAAWTVLAEEPGVAPPAFNGDVLARGDAAAGFSLFVGDPSNANTPVSGLSADSLAGVVSLRGVDYLAQEDARDISWSGKSKGSLKVAAIRPVQLSDWAEGSALALVLTWKVDAAPEGEFTLRLGCGDGCEGDIEMAPLMTTVEGEGWTETAISLACITSETWDASHALEAIELSTASRANIDLSAMRFRQALPADACPGLE